MVAQIHFSDMKAIPGELYAVDKATPIIWPLHHASYMIECRIQVPVPSALSPILFRSPPHPVPLPSPPPRSSPHPHALPRADPLLHGPRRVCQEPPPQPDQLSGRRPPPPHGRQPRLDHRGKQRKHLSTLNILLPVRAQPTLPSWAVALPCFMLSPRVFDSTMQEHSSGPCFFAGPPGCRQGREAERHGDVPPFQRCTRPLQGVVQDPYQDPYQASCRPSQGDTTPLDPKPPFSSCTSHRSMVSPPSLVHEKMLGMAMGCLWALFPSHEALFPLRPLCPHDSRPPPLRLLTLSPPPPHLPTSPPFALRSVPSTPPPRPTT